MDVVLLNRQESSTYESSLCWVKFLCMLAFLLEFAAALDEESTFGTLFAALRVQMAVNVVG